MGFRWVWWVLAVAWCTQIYFFTALPVYNDEHTRGFLDTFLSNFLSQQMIGVIDYLIRKAAHVTVFGVLAFLVKMALGSRRRWFYYLAWIFTAFYAATDEFHQSFVPGRTAVFSDVMIDSAGAFLFLLVLFGWERRRAAVGEKRKGSGQSGVWKRSM